jgi:hypothetical protein
MPERENVEEGARGLGGALASATGTGDAGEATSAAPIRVIDPLELSLAPPGMTWARLDASRPRVGHTPSSAPELAGLERVVERLSFGGDGRSGTARIELGARFAGVVIVVHTSGREVELSLELSQAGTRALELGERVAARLRKRGFEAVVSVR